MRKFEIWSEMLNFLAKIRPKKQKIEILLQRHYADSAKEHSYEVLSL